ncbi:hypothetical protein HED52_01320 [Ochrobactrum ciceri]|uniref:Uncharacterized protein n=1 Tax=Brucella ciceri TaxID=391287 RepID=A0ABX1DRN3_9HYPH|nr:hypothetical protein [Brucella ciceri]
MSDIHVELLERSIVEKYFDPFASSELAFGVLHVDAVLTAAEGLPPDGIQAVREVPA